MKTVITSLTILTIHSKKQIYPQKLRCFSCVSRTCTPVLMKLRAPYSVLLCLAEELVSILEGNCTMEELEQYKAMLSN